MKTIKLIIILTLSLVSCNQDSDTTPSTKNNNQDKNSSNDDILTFNYNQTIREYIMYIPSSYNSNKPIPLVFNFHGFGGIISEYVNEADMRNEAEDEGFIVVYPQGTNLDGYSHLNAALPSDENKSNTDDFGFIESLITELSNNYNINEERIYACGYSNGGFFSYGLACYLSNKIAAIGAISSTMIDISKVVHQPTMYL